MKGEFLGVPRAGELDGLAWRARESPVALPGQFDVWLTENTNLGTRTDAALAWYTDHAGGETWV